uniref:hypothetical protein n=1 Tax=Haslea pseudostrearia TaxID=197756 RepID=UPI00220D17D3|nr:hypothetical protein ON958_mgp18 [Haslea pseudostrearia]UXN44205.1 hypothetical protein [Haslea pseudostrearia]
MRERTNLWDSSKLCFLCYFLVLEKSTLEVLHIAFPFYLELSLEYIILNTVDWVENNSHLILYWFIFIITMSLCVRNEYGHDIETLHYIIFITAMGYCIYVYKHFFPRETSFLIIKLSSIGFMLLQLFWSLIVYTWPYSFWVIPLGELKNLFFFLWPYLDFTQYFKKWGHLL